MKWAGAFLLAQLTLASAAEAQEKLIFAADVIRHGDRTPLGGLPAAPHTWAEGLGQLTPEGIRQEFALGSRMRAAYVERDRLLPASYEPGTIYVRSSDVDRTLMSAEAFLTGLYPPGTGPKAGEREEPALPDAVQPIPIHTVEFSRESLLFPENAVYKFDDLIARHVLSTPDWETREAEFRPRFVGWGKALGVKIKSLVDVVDLADILIIYQLHHVALPPELTAEDVRTLIDAGQRAFAAEFKAAEVGRMTGRELLKVLAVLMRDASGGGTALKYALFSAHDSTILSEMSALGAPLAVPPPYASRLNFSFYQAGKDYVVRISYNDQPVSVPACGGESCTLAQFMALAGS